MTLEKNKTLLNIVLCLLFEVVSGGVYLSAGGSLRSTT